MRGRPTGQLGTPLVQPTHGTECEAETLTEAVPPARLPYPHLHLAPASLSAGCPAGAQSHPSPWMHPWPRAGAAGGSWAIPSLAPGLLATLQEATMAVMSPWAAPNPACGP